MNTSLLRRLTLFTVLAVTALSCGQFNRDPSLAAYYVPTNVAHGEYLVQKVGMCADCHSPRNERGEFVQERWLQGSVLPFAPSVPMPWAPAAPIIAGLPSLTDAQAVEFLTTGNLPGGRRPLPPMPEYHLAESDAKDVVAYLRSQAPKAAPKVAAAGQ